ETGIRGWGLTGEESALAPYNRATQRLQSDLRVLEEFASDQPRLAGPAAELSAASRAWIEEYAEVRLDRAAGQSGYDPRLFAGGQERFERIRSAHDGLRVAFEEIIADARAEFRARLTVSLLLIIAFVALAGVLSIVVGGRGVRRVTEPLEQLEAVVLRIAQEEPGVRAVVEGPREIRAVASALNQLAQERDSSREVENQMQQELRALDSAKDDFVSNVSHELRTPLTTINGYLEIITDEFEGQMDPRHEKMLHATWRNLARLQSLIEDLLTLSRSEAAATDLERIDLASVLTDVVEELGITARRRGVGLHCDLLAGQHVLADRSQLTRAFVNLISNAVKFNKPNGCVDVRMKRVGPLIEIEIVDQGIGIPASELQHVGTRFYRASNAVQGEVSGTGLGLRIVQTIVANHGGTLHLESVEGSGTTALVQLPALGD
ncbi:ATP-binding protein, partial [Nocardioides sp.]|uniref:sensor histidine kinase n=1 Tax=Nocardioides sp. TaxID=35761 RepID=UPI00273754CD